MITSPFIIANLKCIFESKQDPCDYCKPRGLECVKRGGTERKVDHRQDTLRIDPLPTIPRPPSIPDYSQLNPQEEHVIRFLYESIATSFDRHREIVRMIQGRSGPFISNPCLRNATIAYAAQKLKSYPLVESSQDAFRRSIRKITRKTVDLDHMHGFLLMTYVCRRLGAWSAVTEYMKYFARILQDVVDQRVTANWFTPTMYLETVWSIRGLNRARPLTGDWKEDTIIFIDTLDLTLENCSLLVTATHGISDPTRNKIFNLMLYNQDILHTIKTCFAALLRYEQLPLPAHFELCRAKLRAVRKRMKMLEADSFFQEIRNMDQSFILRSYAPQNPFELVPQSAYYSGTDIDPVSQDLLSKYQKFGLPMDPHEDLMAYFKRTSGGIRRLTWTRYLRNVVLLYLLEIMIKGYSRRNGHDSIAKFVIIAAETATQFGLSFNYMNQLLLYGFSLAEVAVMQTYSGPLTGTANLTSKLTDCRRTFELDFRYEGCHRGSR